MIQISNTQENLKRIARDIIAKQTCDQEIDHVSKSGNEYHIEFYFHLGEGNKRNFTALIYSIYTENEGLVAITNQKSCCIKHLWESVHECIECVES